MPVTQYEVEPGDTLSRIAAKFGITLGGLLDANSQIADPNTVRPGQKINIPGGAPAPVVPAAPDQNVAHEAPANSNWLDRIFNFTVEKREIPRLGNAPYRAMERTGIGVLHTTEGSRVIDAIDAMEHGLKAGKPSDPCHFIAGENRIVQCRPLGFQAASLRGAENQFPYVQIEMVSLSRTTSWLPDDATLRPAVAIVAYCSRNLGIPLSIPNNWADNIDDVKPFPASNNTRRTAGIWPQQGGWYMHMEVSNQQPSNHWDCGAIRRSELLQMARSLAEE